MQLDHLDRLAAPYPVWIARDLFAPDRFAQLHDAWPDEGSHAYTALGSGFNKRTLQVGFAPLRPDVGLAPCWYDFDAEVRGLAFLAAARSALGEAVTLPDAPRMWWEFSSLPADGGGLMPHTDAASKLVSLVVWMMRPGDGPDDWRTTEWGGGMDVIDAAGKILHTVGCAANSAIVFVKTPISWHGVRPIHGPPGRYRRTLTVIFYG